MSLPPSISVSLVERHHPGLPEKQPTPSWRSGQDVGGLVGTPIRLRFELKDADLYSEPIGEIESTATRNSFHTDLRRSARIRLRFVLLGLMY